MNQFESQILHSTILNTLRVHLKDGEIRVINKTVQDLRVDLNFVKNYFNLFCQILYEICEVSCSKVFSQIFEAHFSEWVSLLGKITQLAKTGHQNIATLRNGLETVEVAERTNKIETISLKQDNEDVQKDIKERSFLCENSKFGVSEVTKADPMFTSGTGNYSASANSSRPADGLRLSNGTLSHKADSPIFKNEEQIQRKGLITEGGARKNDEITGATSSSGTETKSDNFSEEEQHQSHKKPTNMAAKTVGVAKPGSAFSANLQMFQKSDANNKHCTSGSNSKMSTRPIVPVKPTNIINHQKQPAPLTVRPPPTPPASRTETKGDLQAFSIDFKSKNEPQKLDMSKFDYLENKINKTKEFTVSLKTECPYPNSSSTSVSDSESTEFYGPSQQAAALNYTGYQDVGNENSNSNMSASIEERYSDIYDNLNTDNYQSADMEGNYLEVAALGPNKEGVYDELPPTFEAENRNSKTSKTLTPKFLPTKTKEKDVSKKSKKKNKSSDD